MERKTIYSDARSCNMRKINEVAKLTGVTVRTLQYYDKIGLLPPSDVTEAGYRVYDEVALEKLQQILFFRELEFSLNDIKEIMTNPNYDKQEALEKHKELLIQKRNRIDGLIDLLTHIRKGDKDMSFKQFDDSDFTENRKKYAAEVRERWGKTEAFVEYEEKTNSYTNQQWDNLTEEGKAILKEFGENRMLQADSNEAQMLVEKWKDYISNHYYTCTPEILACLGLMYVNDERFTRNIDKNGDGTAAFMAAAIKVYSTK